METTAIALFALIGLLGTGSPALAQKTSCKDIPLQWFIYQVAADDQTAVPAAISGDGNWYSASSGTSNTVIHVCGIEASRDATMLVGSRRKVAFGFTPPVTGSVIQESIPAGTYYDSPFMNVRNILCIGCADPHQPFTTRMGLQLKINNEDYRLRFMPTVTVAPDRHTDPDAIPAENVPYEASPVLVIPQSYDCLTGGSVKPSWIVRGLNPSSDPDAPTGESLQLGTLTRVLRKGIAHAGQYSMPFELRIEALTCFAY